MSTPKSRIFQIALVAIAALLVVLVLPLIGNIHEIEFQTSREIDFSMPSSSGGSPPDSPGWLLFTILLRVLFVLAAIAFIFQFIANRAFRRMYIFLFLFFGALILVSDLLDWKLRDPGQSQSAGIEMVWETPLDDLDQPTVNRDVASSNFQAILLAIALSSVVVLVGGVLVYKRLKNRPTAEDDGYDEILATITDAAHQLRAGADPRTVVLFCYQEMIRILSTVGKIDASCLTAREFETRLRSLGMSGDSITELTAIFEIVRYAGRVDTQFAGQALACLEAIQEAHAIDEY